MLIDTHAHLNDTQYNQDRDQVVKRALASGVRAIISVGYDMEAVRAAVALAQCYADVYAAVGIHPHHAREMVEDNWAELEGLIRQPKVVAIGEIGLDFYRNLSPQLQQEEIFRRQLAIVRSSGLPVIIHDRDAHQATLRILQNEGLLPAGGVFHCFSGDRALARQCLDLGFYLSFAGPVTFKNASQAIEVARWAPLDRLLVETDCPYLAPEPYRGKRNEPAFVANVASRIAQLRGLPLEAVAEATTTNAKKLFGLSIN